MAHATGCPSSIQPVSDDKSAPTAMVASSNLASGSFCLFDDLLLVDSLYYVGNLQRSGADSAFSRVGNAAMVEASCFITKFR